MRDTVSEEHPPGAEPGGGSAIDAEPERYPRRPFWPVVVVGLTVLVNLWVLRAEARPVQNLNDASVHRSMVAWANDRIEGGHLPLDGWYPDLSLGSSRFHHYQSFPHVLTGYLAVPLGPERAVSLTLYLLLATWPIAVYAGGRLMTWGPWPSAMAAAMSSLIVSEPGLGYEWGSYLWRGYGTWSQLWGMWLLPFAWALGWRAVARGKGYAVASLVLALTVACHLITGYLALLALGLWVIVAPSEFRRRLVRAVVVSAGALLTAAWVVVPLLADRAWTIQDEFSRDKPFYDSFGAKQVMSWFASGELFDRSRLPVITALVVVGIVICVRRFRREERSRVLLFVGFLSLLLFFGRPTLGPVLRLLPGSGDVFLRRFVLGVHLAGLYLAGIAAVALGRWGLRLVRSRWSLRPAAVGVIALVVALVVLSPAIVERSRFASTGARWIGEQAAFDATDGADVDELIEIARADGPGRLYAGMRSNWGAQYKIGQVPMYAVLLNHSVEGVGFTRPTWSLSSPMEFRFNDSDPTFFDLFDVRYVIMPSGDEPRVPAEELATRGEHVLWRVETRGYVGLVDVLPATVADRTNLGERMEPWLRSDLSDRDLFPSVTFAGIEGAEPTVRDTESAAAEPPGRVVVESVDLRDGRATASVIADRSAMVVLKASFDPRWQVTVDGIAFEPQMIAPSFVGRMVPPGRHVVTFTYEPFPRYDVLLLVGALTLAALAIVPRRSRATRSRP